MALKHFFFLKDGETKEQTMKHDKGNTANL